ncbi:MAG: hypothetical protein EZS28_031912 [Streblomastix strix]|uniref:Zn(2)-C6 fungal-type domain-containing protein n=1 Tax=Streblomastix strix TaxID=222440 RepID=A0A5J4URA9_9EUKA|nr:MAG: hypothetical protein EZS28_031912 [Streblomastix strix]
MQRRQIVLQACDACRMRKIRCDGVQPCSACLSRKDTCTFDMPVKKRGPNGKKKRALIRKLAIEQQSTQMQTGNTKLKKKQVSLRQSANIISNNNIKPSKTTKSNKQIQQKAPPLQNSRISKQSTQKRNQQQFPSN